MVFEVEPDIVNVAAFWEGIVSGLINVNVLVIVIDKYVPVLFRRVQKDPPSVVTVLAGSVRALNALLVR